MPGGTLKKIAPVSVMQPLSHEASAFIMLHCLQLNKGADMLTVVSVHDSAHVPFTALKSQELPDAAG